MGRPTKCTRGIITHLARYLAEGLDRRTAAYLVGIHPGTMAEWIRRGELALTRAAGRQPAQRERIYAEAAMEIQRAEAQSERMRIKAITEAAKGGAWRAGAWLLERQFPERWAQRVPSPQVDAQIVREQLAEVLGVGNS